MRRAESFFRYDPTYDGFVDYVLRTGQHNEPGMLSQLRDLGFEVIEPPGVEGDCQSWAFDQLNIPKLRRGPLTVDDLKAAGFLRTTRPTKGALASYPFVHYGLFYDIFHGQKRIMSKLGVKGAVCVHPCNAFSGGSLPTYFEKR